MVISSDWILSLAIIGNTYKAIYNLPLRFYHLGKHKALRARIDQYSLSVSGAHKENSIMQRCRLALGFYDLSKESWLNRKTMQKEGERA